MWIFKNDAFLSIVAHRGDSAVLLVRGRVAGDIERVFPAAKVKHTPNNDYPYRAEIPRNEVAYAIANSIADIDYPNFKASVDERDRHDAYLDVWLVMRWLQKHRAGAAVPSLPPGLADSPSFDADTQIDLGCPYDTDGDGDCGRPLCEYCGSYRVNGARR